VALALIGAAGCGDDGPTDEQQVRATITAYATATATKDYRLLCRKVLSKVLVRKIQAVGLTCERAVQRGLGDVQAPKLAIRRVRIRKDVALAEVTSSAAGQAPSTDTLRLVREAAGWRIAALSGAQPPAPVPSQQEEAP
jgi:hypothetical protein